MKRRAEEQAAREAELKQQAEEQAKREAQLKRQAEEQANREAELRRHAEEQAAREAQERARQEAIAKAAADAAIERAMRITRFVNNYEGGDCFFVTPLLVAADRTDLDGYGYSPEPFDLLDTEFQRANGFEADIALHQVTLAQCAAVTFLSRTRNQPGVAPSLEISAATMNGGSPGTLSTPGSPLTGSIAGVGNRHVDLLLIAEDGTVHNLSSHLSPGDGDKSFTLDLPRKDRGPGQPQLLFAVASQAPLESLKPGRLGTAEEVFDRALKEARDTGQALNVRAKYFKLEK